MDKIFTNYYLFIILAAALMLGACQPVASPTPTASPEQPSAVAAPTPTLRQDFGELSRAAQDKAAPDVAPPQEKAPGVNWYEWEPETFALAQDENKLILLDLTAVWCHWCHVMDETTYSHPEVIQLINELYIPIRVDTDQRPDIQARYLMGGWPTTGFLSPQGDILTGYTYVPPEDMLTLLQEISDYYVANEADVAAQIAQLYQQRDDDRVQPVSGVPTDTLQLALDQLAASYDPVNGGFGEQPKFITPGDVPLILRHNYSANDTAWNERLVRTLYGMSHLLDPVWGGMYRYSVSADWGTPHYEKMLSGNAEALASYLQAYQATGDDIYREISEAILRYVDGFLRDPDGGFYGSQDADLVRAGGHEIVLDGEEYFLLPEDERLALGLPYVDQTFYADWNGQMIVAMLQAAAVLEQPRYREMALLALERLWAQGRGPQGQMWHSGDGPPATLIDQTQFGLALLAAYSSTGQREHLARAEELAAYTLAQLQAPQGGFYDLPYDPDASGALAFRETLCEYNVVAARFFTRLYWITERDDYRQVAEGALRLCGSVMAANSDYALAADDLLRYPLTLAVVGDPGREDTGALLAAANRFYRPGKVVVPLDPTLGAPALGEFSYPPDRVAIYACLDLRCSLPIQDPADLVEQVHWLENAGG